MSPIYHKFRLVHPKRVWKVEENQEKLELSWKQIFIYADNVNLYGYNTQTTKKNKFYQALHKEAGLEVKLVLYRFLILSLPYHNTKVADKFFETVKILG